MPFGQPVVGGIVLVRPAIQSPDYQPGIAGWTINYDGSAEFNNVTVRGTLFVTDPDGSYVKIYDENPGDGAIIEFHLPTAAGINQSPGFVQTGTDPIFTGTKGMSIIGPTYGAVPPRASIISLTPGFAVFDATAMDFVTRGDWEVAFELIPNTFTVEFQIRYPSGDVFCNGLNARGDMTISGDGGANTRQVTASNECINVPAAPGNVAAAGFVNLPATGPSPSSFVIRKQYAATSFDVFISADAISSAVNTVAQYGVLINGVDYPVTDLTMNIAANHYQGSGVAKVAAGLAAGNYTVQGRWQRIAGAGTVSTGGRLSMTAAEVA
jgi:hypothetical protein